MQPPEDIERIVKEYFKSVGAVDSPLNRRLIHQLIAEDFDGSYSHENICAAIHAVQHGKEIVHPI